MSRGNGGDGDDRLFGDASTMRDNAVAGDDHLEGGDGDDFLSGDAHTTLFNAVAGDDKLNGGDGNDTLVGDAITMRHTSVAGDDTLDGGAGDDVLFGDYQSFFDTPATGADTFVFGATDGNDTVKDFRASDGDVMDFSDTGLSWSDLDTSGNGTLGAEDDFVSGAGTTVIDIGAANGGLAGEHTVTVEAVTGLAEADFLFS